MNSPLAIQWGASNEIGIPVLDEQHRGVVSIINSLAFSIEYYNGEFAVNNTFSTFNMVNSYIKLHFATEEELMRASGYDELEWHRKMHENLIKESFSIANQSLRSHNADLYLQFLKKWWMDHINGCDRLYGERVKAYMMSKHML